VHSFTEPDLFENNVLIDNTTPIYLIFVIFAVLDLRVGGCRP